MRRTSHIDMIFTDAGLALRGAARDLWTDADGRAHVVAEGTVDAQLGHDRALASITVTPERDVSGLIGLPVAGGFRAAVDRVVPREPEEAAPLHLLLDELPVAALISGYALLYLGDLPQHAPGQGPALKSDICAGWRHDGTMMVSVRATGQVPVPLGPIAPPDYSTADPAGWHAIGPLPVGAMRRRRLVEVGAGDPAPIVAMFRDTHVQPDGTEAVLHEYRYAGAVDLASSTVVASEATPQVLPWIECPEAAASATRLVGHAVDELRDLVRTDLRGTTTCTHLNDLLRSLGDVGPLLAELQRRSG
jgi:hypothetical protein